MVELPKRSDLEKIMIIGSGPIIIGQAAEFDFSGSQACQSIREEGYKSVLVNSNPATIQTDMEIADTIYIEPLTMHFVERIIEKEKPDGILSGMGGQTALNICSELAENGVLKRFDVELLGTQLEAIAAAEDRDLFRKAMRKIGLRIPKSGIATNMDKARAIADEIGFPIIIRPAFTLGGTGGGVAYNPEELEKLAKGGIDASLINQVMLEESVLGWKEYELEVMRDQADQCVVICSIENMDVTERKPLSKWHGQEMKAACTLC